MPDPEILTCPSVCPATLARKLGVHPSTVNRWCAAGRIAAWRTPGGRWRVNLTAAQTLLSAASGESSLGQAQASTARISTPV